MATYNVEKLFNFAQDAVKNNWGYVWGASGQVYTLDVAKALYTTYGSSSGDYNYDYYTNTQMTLWKGHNVADCSGLIQSFRGGTEASAAGLYSGCNTKGDIANFDGQVGGLVFQDKGGIVHVGICVGRGKVIHSSSSKEGVIISDITSRFNKYGLPTWLTFNFTQPTTAITPSSSVLNVCWLQKKLGLIADGEYGAATAQAYYNFATEQGISGTVNGYYVSTQGIYKLATYGV